MKLNLAVSSSTFKSPTTDPKSNKGFCPLSAFAEILRCKATQGYENVHKLKRNFGKTREKTIYRWVASHLHHSNFSKPTTIYWSTEYSYLRVKPDQTFLSSEPNHKKRSFSETRFVMMFWKWSRRSSEFNDCVPTPLWPGKGTSFPACSTNTLNITRMISSTRPLFIRNTGDFV